MIVRPITEPSDTLSAVDSAVETFRFVVMRHDHNEPY
jgi:hypothetical protein